MPLRSTSGRASPTRRDRGARRGPCISIACRRATAPAPRARTSRGGCSTPSPATTKRRGARSRRTTRCRPRWGACAITRAKARATALRSTRRSASIPSSASSATRRSSAAGNSRARNANRARRCWSSAPARRASPLRITCVAWATRVTIVEAGPMAGGMMRFGIPKYRLPRDVLDGEIQRILDTGVKLVLDTKVSDIRATMREGGYDAAFLAVGAHIAKRAYIPAGTAAKMLDAVSVLRSMEGEDKPPARTPRRRLRRRQHRARRRAHGQAPRRRGVGHRLSPHAREDAGARLRGGRGAAGRRHDQVALDHQADGQRGHAHRREDAARRQGLPAAHGRARDPRSRFPRARPRAGRRSVAARRRAGPRDRGRRGAGRAAT